MAALPEDDAPTMTGTPGDRRVELPAPIDDSDGDDTTTAEAGPPAARATTAHDDADEGAGVAAHDEEDRTVQQAVTPPAAAKPPQAKKPNPAELAQKLKLKTPAPAQAVGPPPAPASTTATAPTAPVAGVPASTAKPAPPKPTVTEGSVSESIDSTAELHDGDGDDDDDVEDSITATAPRIDPASLPHNLVIPGSVEIRTVEHDELLDETEVRTRPGHVPLTIPAALRSAPSTPDALASRAPAPRPAAGRPASPPEADDDDDGVTTEAPAPRVGSVPDLGILAVEPREDPPTRPGVSGEVPTRPGGDLETAKRIKLPDSYANEDDEDDESVTTRARPVESLDDESVTAQAPAVPMSVVEAAHQTSSPVGAATLDDGTGGTTQKVKKTRDPSPSSPADGESESITTQAPGPLTNILRVIASGSGPDLPPAPPLDDEEEPPENRTAVMASAPIKRILEDVAGGALPPLRPTGGPLIHGPQAVAAMQLEPSSESGLRARTGSGSGERASLGVLGIADVRPSGVGPIANALASDGSLSGPMDLRAHAPTEMALFPPGEQPSLHDVDLGKGPRYGLLVGIVAVISVIVPVTLFVVLRRPPETLTPREPGEPASEIQKHDTARAKGTRLKNGTIVPVPAASASASAAPSVSPSAALSAAPSAKPGPAGRGGFPFKR